MHFNDKFIKKKDRITQVTRCFSHFTNFREINPLSAILTKVGLSSITVSVFYPHCFTVLFFFVFLVFFVNTNFIKYNIRAADRSFLESLDSTDKYNTYITKTALCGWETEISTLLWQYSFWKLHNLIVNRHSTTKNKTFSSCNLCVIKVWYFS